MFVKTVPPQPPPGLGPHWYRPTPCDWCPWAWESSAALLLYRKQERLCHSPGREPQSSLRGTRLSALPFGSEHWLGTRQPEPPCGSEPRTTVATAAQGWRGEALQVPALCHSVESWPCVGQRARVQVSGPSEGLWPGGMQGRAGQTQGSLGRDCGGAGHPPLPPQPAAVGSFHNDGSVYPWPWSQREGALPPAGAAGRQ